MRNKALRLAALLSAGLLLGGGCIGDLGGGGIAIPLALGALLLLGGGTTLTT